MKKRNKITIAVLSVIIVVGGISFLTVNSSQLQGRMDVNKILLGFPTFECSRSIASVVVSDVSSEVVSEVTSELTSDVPSTITSKVPKCVSKKKGSGSWWKFWGDK